MSNGSDAKIEDDGINLLKQVLAENPPEERGEREEWAQHVGWHRKEDVFKKPSLRGAPSINADANASSAGQESKSEMNLAKPDQLFWNGSRRRSKTR